MSSGKWRPPCLGVNVLVGYHILQMSYHTIVAHSHRRKGQTSDKAIWHPPSGANQRIHGDIIALEMDIVNKNIHMNE